MRQKPPRFLMIFEEVSGSFARFIFLFSSKMEKRQKMNHAKWGKKYVDRTGLRLVRATTRPVNKVTSCLCRSWWIWLNTHFFFHAASVEPANWQRWFRNVLEYNNWECIYRDVVSRRKWQFQRIFGDTRHQWNEAAIMRASSQAHKWNSWSFGR